MKNFQKRRKIIIWALLGVLLLTVGALFYFIERGSSESVRFFPPAITVIIMLILKQLGLFAPRGSKITNMQIREAYHEELTFAKYPEKIEKIILNGLYSIHFNHLTPALKRFKRTLARCVTDNQRAMTYLFIGTAYKEKGLLQNAIINYEKALTFSTYFKIWNSLGVAYSLLDKNEESINYFEKAIESSSENYLAYNNIANAYLALNDYESAIAYAEKSAGLSGSKCEPYVVLALAYSHLNDIEKIKYCYAQLVQRNYDGLESLKFMVNEILYGIDDTEKLFSL